MQSAVTPQFEEATYKKVASRLIPFLFLCYIVAFLDRVNVGFAKLQMAGDLQFSDAVYGGKEQARKAARKYRREVMGDLPPRTTLNTGSKKGAAKRASAKKKARAGR